MIGKIKNFHLKDWEDPITGQIISTNKDWILIHFIPVDYVLDGYKILKRSFIEKSGRGNFEKQRERVLKLRNHSLAEFPNFKFGTTTELINWIELNYELFEFNYLKEKSTYFGKVNRILENEILILDLIDPKGAVIEETEPDFEMNNIRVLSFDSDYFNAIKLLWKDNLPELAKASS